MNALTNWLFMNIMYPKSNRCDIMEIEFSKKWEVDKMNSAQFERLPHFIKKEMDSISEKIRPMMKKISTYYIFGLPLMVIMTGSAVWALTAIAAAENKVRNRCFICCFIIIG